MTDASTYTVRDVAEALSDFKRKVERRALRERWPYTEMTCRGGKRRLYRLSDLPCDVQSVLLKTHGAPKNSPTNEEAAAQAEAEAGPAFTYEAEALWEWAQTRPQKLRDEGAFRAAALHRLMQLLRGGASLRSAARIVEQAEDVSARTLKRWHYRVKGRYEKQDWAAALIPGYVGRVARREIPPQAWDWFCGYYLTRRQPTLTEAYRRTCEAAEANDWGQLPSQKTFARCLTRDVRYDRRLYLREGPEALAKLFPPQRRDKRAFRAGQAVSGDGLKFDRLWVRWPDGEVINTTTGWFWSDIRTNYLAAWRLAKTENTDLFRLATYDLLGKFCPEKAWVDNTRVAASKAMTGGAANRRRGRDKADDPTGLLVQLGIEVRFTNPDKVMGSPGAKPIERSFGIGGIHDKVATHPAFLDRGYSQKTAIPYEEFAEGVRDEGVRLNQQPQRRTAICRGVLSFEEAFQESFKRAVPKKLTEAQRRLLLMMPEVTRADRRSGEVRLKAGQSPMGRHRYWSEALTEYKGRQVVAYYDPAALASPISVYTLEGRYVCRAEHRGDVAFADTSQGREHSKQKTRFIKATKKVAEARRRMRELEVAAQYPAIQEAPPPPPGVVGGQFGQKRQVTPHRQGVNGGVVGPVEEEEGGLSRTDEMILEMAEHWQKEQFG